MGLFDLYSKRRKRERGEVSDVYAYDAIPDALRNQIIQIWRETIGQPYVIPRSAQYASVIDDMYHSIVQVLRKEYGVFQLSKERIDPSNKEDSINDLTVWFIVQTDVEKILDAVELSFRVIDKICSKGGYLGRGKAATVASDAIDELNARFKEHGVGYQFVDGEIIRVDSQLIHQEAVIPALTVLRGTEYSNAQDEFRRAFEHFRHGNKQEALVECCKCFESTMKVICNKRGWGDTARATVSDLVRMCFDNGLIPPYWQNHFSGLRSVLESSIATPRNRQAGHGAGSAPAQEPPDELVSYVLHMTASTVLFLTEAEKRLP